MTLRNLVPWRRENDGGAVARREPDPFSVLRSEMDRLFEDFGRGFGLGLPAWPGESLTSFSPRLDVEETESELVVTVELPGLEHKDFEVELESDRLVIRGEKRQEQSGKEGWTERCYGSFHRALALPREIEVDKASASFKNGILRVTLPKTREARERVRRIPVEAS